MKTLEDWFEEYNVSHQNVTNIKIHYICVPLIFFSVVGLLMSVPSELLLPLATIHPILANWAFIVLALALLFYFRLSLATGLQMALFSALCLFINYIIAQQVSILWCSLILFLIGWIAQFYGHNIEGKKPSFLKDLQFLLISPAWIMHKLFNEK